MNKVIEEIYRTGRTLSSTGESIPLQFSIDPVEGRFLARVVASDSSIRKTAEVGCANGLSALHICEAARSRPDSRHFILDPNQSTHYRGAGVHALDRAGLTRYTLLEEPSEIGLPRLLREHGPDSFDLIFVDGWHTFDHTLIDCFYATKLLRPGGHLVVDDCNAPPIAKVMAHLKSYPCYETAGELMSPVKGTTKRVAVALASCIPLTRAFKAGLPPPARRLFRIPNMVWLKKIARDERTSDWHRPF